LFKVRINRPKGLSVFVVTNRPGEVLVLFGVVVFLVPFFLITVCVKR
jgi:hypothetical protein